MLHTIRYNYRLYPNKEQIVFFSKTIGCSRFVHNYYLDVRSSAYKENGVSLNYKDTSNMLTDLKRNDDYHWLKEVDSIALQESLRDLDRSFKAFFSKNAKYPRFHKKGHNDSYRTRNQKNSIRIENNYIVLPKVGAVKAKISRIPNGRILNATIMHKPSGKWFISLCVEEEYNVLPNNGCVVGVDVGLKQFYTDSNGNEVANPRFLGKYTKKIRKAQKKLSRRIAANIDHYIVRNNKRYPVYKKPLSECKNIQKQRKRLATLHEKVANSRTDFLYKQTRILVSENQVIGIEDLNVSGMMRNHKLARGIADVSWSEFFRILEYQATKFGSDVIKVPRFYASSQTCSVCGYQNKLVKDLKIRKWVCPKCGAENGRDVNAAINIKNQAIAIYIAA